MNSPCFLWFVSDDSFPVNSQNRSSSFFCPIVVRETENRQPLQFFISAAKSALTKIAALVPVGSVPELSRKRTEPQRSSRACGTYRHALNAPGSNSPIRDAPTLRRCV